MEIFFTPPFTIFVRRASLYFSPISLSSVFTTIRIFFSDERISFEIPYRYWSLANKNLDVVNFGNHPFVIPDKAYSSVLGVLSAYIEPMYYNRDEQFL